MTAPATLLLAHSRPHVIRAWRTLVRPHCGRYHIGGEAATTGQMLQVAASLQPAVVLMDAGLAGKCITNAVEQLRACTTNTRLLISWQYRHERLVQPLPGPPVAYLAEDAQLWEMLRALSLLMRGTIYYCRQSEKLLHPPAAREPLPKGYRQLLWCKWQGHTREDMAMATGLSVNTVDGYLKEIYAFIGSRSMCALENFMRKEGML